MPKKAPRTPSSQNRHASQAMAVFKEKVWREGARLYRDLPWRRTTNPYHVFVSEVMLQQTQVVRVEKHWDSWIERFPVLDALAEAPLADVLATWQGMGYNRRAIALQQAAQMVVSHYGGCFPQTTEELIKLPGVGAATAAGLRAFAFNLPSLYLETNVRTVFLHEFFPDAVGVPDAELLPLLAEACPGYMDLPDAPELLYSSSASHAYGSFANAQSSASPSSLANAGLHGGAMQEHGGAMQEHGKTLQEESKGPRAWYYALLDYGANLKKTVPNPSRRSKSHTKQSAYEGSRRQKRAELIRLLLAAQELTLDELTEELSSHEKKEGRPGVDAPLVQSIMEDLEQEGFCVSADGTWSIPS